MKNKRFYSIIFVEPGWIYKHKSKRYRIKESGLMKGKKAIHMKNFLQKFVGALLVACFTVSSMGGVAFAHQNNKHDNGYRNHGNKYDNYGHRKDRDKSERFILNRLNVSKSVWNYAQRNGMTMRDVMIAKRIADKSPRLSVESVLKLRKKGNSYQSIANRYNVRWDRVDSEVNDSHKNLVRDAIKIGLVIWALDELID